MVKNAVNFTLCAHPSTFKNNNHKVKQYLLVLLSSTLKKLLLNSNSFFVFLVIPSYRVFTWGWGVHGQLGHGDAENQSIPKLVSCLPTAKEIRTIQLAAGYAHTMVLSQQVRYFCFIQERAGRTLVMVMEVIVVLVVAAVIL